MRFYELRSAEDIVRLVQEVGFLPFFANGICGFSVEENCPPELWFADDVDGPWEWKGPAIKSGKCLYGKFFNGKAGFVSAEWFPDFANYRRDGYDFDSRCDEGLAPHKDKYLYETVEKSKELLSKDLKLFCNYRKGGNTGFETIITRLQMQTYLCIADFVYQQDKHGKPYGWGVAKYSTPEELFGYEMVSSAYKREPMGSLKRIVDHLSRVLPDASDMQIQRLICI